MHHQLIRPSPLFSRVLEIQIRLINCCYKFSWSLFCAQPGRLCVQALGKDIKLQSTTVFAIFARFLYVFGASLVVGLTFGLGTAVLLKVLKSNSAPQVSLSA